MEHFKGILGIVLLTLLSIVPANHVEASSKKYLVLIQSNSDQWTAYDNLTEVTSSGSIMLIAKPFAEIMKFEYSENTEKKQFTLKRSQIQYNTYSLNSKNYSYTNRGKSKSMKANYKAYISKSDKNNLCYADSVSTLCYYKMFKGSDIEDFKQLGYDGVLCYSLSDKISKVPYILNVRYPKGTGLKKRLSSDVHYLEVNKSGQINITLSDSKVDDMPLIYKVGDENIITCSWGILSDDIVPLNIEAKSVGITYINVYLSDYSEHITILIYAVEVTEVSDSGSEIDKQNPETSEQQGYIYLTTYYDTYTLGGKLTWRIIDGIYFQRFSGTITNISGYDNDFGSYCLVFRTDNGSLIKRKMHTITGLKSNRVQLIYSSFASTKLCRIITLELVNADFEGNINMSPMVHSNFN